jgi:hypothetical protein
MEACVKSYAEVCVDQNHSLCCSPVPLLLVDRLLVVGLELDNEELTACLPVPRCSSGPLCLAETPGNTETKFELDDLKTHYNKMS